MQGKILTILRWSALAVLGSYAIAQAQTATALVLEVSGTTTPRLEPYGEILDNLTIRLAKKARLLFLHYDSCRMVTVMGGTIAFGSGAYTITGGATAQESQVDCPKRVNVIGNAAAVQLRGSAKRSLAMLSTQPTFVLVGKRARDFVTLRVSQRGAVLLEAPVHSRRVPWPLATPPLVGATECEVRLIPAVGDDPPVSVMFMVVDPGDRVTGQAITLLSVE